MDVRKHRVAAVSILAVGVIGLLGWGRSMGIDGDDVRIARERLRGEWVATEIRAGESGKVEGPTASACRITFEGKEVIFRRMVEGTDGRGSYRIDPTTDPAGIDLKLDAGWVVGIYQINGATLTLCVNSLSLPDRLGVPARQRPARIRSGDGRQLYVFRKATPGP